jgi:Xaa-Pro aminopeptidase
MDIEIHNNRLKRLRAKFAALDVDGLLVSSTHNRRWLSGFSGSAGDLLVTSDQALLITDSRYWERAETEAPACRLWRQGSRRREDRDAGIRASGARRIGLEAHLTAIKTYAELQQIAGVTWVPLDPVIEPMRAVKTPEEIALLRRAAAIADRAMETFASHAKPNLPEKALAWELERAMREDGADGVAFDIIVASGPNAALPHHRAGARLLAIGDSIVVDMGALLSGYHSDLTRSFYLGGEPDSRFTEIYETVLRAHTAAISAIRPGVLGGDVDAVAREIIAAAGYGDHFGHSLGHGTGLEIHEEPRLSQSGAPSPLAANMVVTVEPGIYLPGWGGVRIEDLVLVTEYGCESLSQAKKAPVIA